MQASNNSGSRHSSRHSSSSSSSSSRGGGGAGGAALLGCQHLHRCQVCAGGWLGGCAAEDTHPRAGGGGGVVHLGPRPHMWTACWWWWQAVSLSPCTARAVL
jgi:hypothetical protein